MTIGREPDHPRAVLFPDAEPSKKVKKLLYRNAKKLASVYSDMLKREEKKKRKAEKAVEATEAKPKKSKDKKLKLEAVSA